MSLIDFVKDAGEKLFGRGQAQAAMTEVKADPNNEAKVQAANAAAGDAILDYIKSQNLSATGLTVTSACEHQSRITHHLVARVRTLQLSSTFRPSAIRDDLPQDWPLSRRSSGFWNTAYRRVLSKPAEFVPSR